jgi:serine/threonine-protein kinase RsbW
MQDAHQIRLEIPSDAEYVGVVRQAIGGIARRMRFDPSDIDDLKLAVGEACTNAVRHGCPSVVNPSVSIICTVSPAVLEIEISNGLAGGQQCPVIVGSLECDPKNAKEGGMGLYIMRKLMDEVDVVWEEHEARIRMVKRLPNKSVSRVP